MSNEFNYLTSLIFHFSSTENSITSNYTIHPSSLLEHRAINPKKFQYCFQIFCQTQSTFDQLFPLFFLGFSAKSNDIHANKQITSRQTHQTVCPIQFRIFRSEIVTIQLVRVVRCKFACLRGSTVCKKAGPRRRRFDEFVRLDDHESQRLGNGESQQA